MLTQENFSSVIDEVMHGGQGFGPVPAEAFRAFAGQLLFHGMSSEEVKMMAQIVPARVLGLE